MSESLIGQSIRLGIMCNNRWSVIQDFISRRRRMGFDFDNANKLSKLFTDRPDAVNGSHQDGLSVSPSKLRVEFISSIFPTNL
jgi:hypothetical protein